MKKRPCPDHGAHVKGDWDYNFVSKGSKEQCEWWEVERKPHKPLSSRGKQVGPKYLCEKDHAQRETPHQILQQLQQGAYKGKHVECLWHLQDIDLRANKIPHKKVKSPGGNWWLLHELSGGKWGCCQYDHSDLR